MMRASDFKILVSFITHFYGLLQNIISRSEKENRVFPGGCGDQKFVEKINPCNSFVDFVTKQSRPPEHAHSININQVAIVNSLSQFSVRLHVYEFRDIHHNVLRKFSLRDSLNN